MDEAAIAPPPPAPRPPSDSESASASASAEATTSAPGPGDFCVVLKHVVEASKAGMANWYSAGQMPEATGCYASNQPDPTTHQPISGTFECEMPVVYGKAGRQAPAQLMQRAQACLGAGWEIESIRSSASHPQWHVMKHDQESMGLPEPVWWWDVWAQSDTDDATPSESSEFTFAFGVIAHKGIGPIMMPASR